MCVGERWTGWVKLLQRSVPIKKDNKKAICLLFSPDGSDTVFNVQREYGNQESPSHSLHNNLYMSTRTKDLVEYYLIWLQLDLLHRDRQNH